jgi:hypothetical protein
MSSNDSDFSAAAELALQIPDAEKRRVEGEVSDIGPVMVSAGGQNGSQPGGGGGLGQQLPDQLPGVESLADTAEEQLRAAELQTDLLRELLEDSGAALAGGGGGDGGGGGGGGGGLGIPGAGLLARGGSLLAGGVSAASAGLAGAGALGVGAIGFSLTQDPREDARVPTNDQGEADLFANAPELRPSNQIEGLLDGVDINKPDWLGGDGTINVDDDSDSTPTPDEDSEDSNTNRVNTDPTDSTQPTEGGDIRLANAADRQADEEQVVNTDPTDSTRPTEGGDLRLAEANEQASQDFVPTQGGEPTGPGGGVDLNTGFPSASTGPAANEAADRRRQNAPTINAEARVEGDGISERRAERIAEEKAEEAAEKIRDEIRRPGR